MTVTKIGYRAPSDYSESSPILHEYDSENGSDFALVTECTDGVGYIIETMNDGVGLTTFWRATTFAEAVAFTDAAVESGEVEL